MMGQADGQQQMQEMQGEEEGKWIRIIDWPIHVSRIRLELVVRMKICVTGAVTILSNVE